MPSDLHDQQMNRQKSMATKRSSPDDNTRSHPPHKRRKPAADHTKPFTARAGTSFKKAYTVNELKSQIRSLRRLLEHRNSDNLPADVRVEKERALQTAQAELDANLRAQRRSDTIARWHKVRFFDRQKAAKRLNRAKKELRACEEGGAERDDLVRRVQEAEVDVNYAMYFPLDVPYEPLFPTRRKASGDRKTTEGLDEGSSEAVGGHAAEAKGNVDIRRRVEQCMVDGTLSALREGKLTGNLLRVADNQAPGTQGEAKTRAGAYSETQSVRSKRQKSVLKKKDEQAQGSSDEDGGGFFE